MVDQITDEASNILIPKTPHPMIRNLEKCQNECRTNLRKHVYKLVKLSISEDEADYDLKVLAVGKNIMCENIKIITNHVSGNNESK